jgi:hypothetical protein
MALLIPSLTGSPNEVNQTVNRLGQESTLFTQTRPLKQDPQALTESVFRSGLQPITSLPSQFTNTVGSFAPSLPQKVSYMFVAPATGQQSMSGGSSGQQQPPR